jgi:hypothetical protein
MGDLIDHPYRRLPRQVVDKLVRTGYLPAGIEASPNQRSAGRLGSL